MKKIVFLLFFSITIFACSTSNNPAVAPDPIIGQWQLTQIFVDDLDITSDCQNRTMINFNANGNLTAEIFDRFRGACASNGEQQGSWENQTSTTYVIDYGNGNPKTVIVSFANNISELTILETGDNYTIVSVFEKEAL